VDLADRDPVAFGDGVVERILDALVKASMDRPPILDLFTEKRGAELKTAFLEDALLAKSRWWSRRSQRKGARRLASSR